MVYVPQEGFLGLMSGSGLEVMSDSLVPIRDALRQVTGSASVSSTQVCSFSTHCQELTEVLKNRISFVVWVVIGWQVLMSSPLPQS